MRYFTTMMGVQLLMSGKQLLHPLHMQYFIVPPFTQSPIWLTRQHKHLDKTLKMAKLYPYHWFLPMNQFASTSFFQMMTW